MWEAYYIEAPLLETSYINNSLLHQAVTSMQLHHSGFALRSLANRSVLVWQYDAANGFLPAILPNISDSGITWHNDGIVKLNESFDASYWKRANYQGTLSDTQAQQFVAWVRDVFNRSVDGSRAPDYSPYDVVDPTANNKLRIRSQTCNDFSLAAVQETGLSFSLVPNRKCRLILYSNESLTQVADNNTELVQYWTDIYSLFSSFNTTNVHSLILSAYMLTYFLNERRTVFIRKNGSNLRVPLTYPFGRYFYEEVKY